MVKTDKWNNLQILVEDNLLDPNIDSYFAYTNMVGQK